MALELRLKICKEGDTIKVSEATGVNDQFNPSGYITSGSPANFLAVGDVSIDNAVDSEIEIDDATLTVLVPGIESAFVFDVLAASPSFPTSNLEDIFSLVPSDFGLETFPQGRYCFEYFWQGSTEDPASPPGRIELCPSVGHSLMIIDDIKCIVDQAAVKLIDIDPEENPEIVNKVAVTTTLVNILEDGGPAGFPFDEDDIDKIVDTVVDLGGEIDEEFDNELSDNCKC